MRADSSEEKRARQRVEVELLIKLRFADLARFRLFTTRNLSEGGLFVTTQSPRAPGTWVQLVVYPPGIELGLPIFGTVVHHVSVAEASARGIAPGMGIQFEDLDEDAQESLQNLVEAVAQDAREAAPAPASRPRPSPPPPPAIATERRTSPRVAARSSVRLRFTDVELFRDFYTKDLSRGGVFVCTSQPLAEGTEVELLLSPPQSQGEIRLEGRVAHVVTATRGDSDATTGMGIEFTSLTLEKRNELAAYLEQVAVDRGPEMLGRVQPRPTAHVRYETAPAFTRVVHHDLRRRRLFVGSSDPRPPGTELALFLHAPQLDQPLELVAQVEDVVLAEDAPGERPGMKTLLIDLTDEFLADLEVRLLNTQRLQRRTSSATKATMLEEAARDDLKAGRRSSAIANLKLALTFDPANESCRKMLQEIQQT